MITAIVQARMSSSRLPGKAVKEILGRPMLELHLERVQRAQSLDKVVVATSVCDDDNAIAAVCEVLDVPCFRGNLDDVLDRYHQARNSFGGDQVVRLTGDCPLADPDLIDKVIAFHIENSNDYTSNVHPQTFPDGLDVEVMTATALERAWKEALLPSHREHVTFYFTEHPEIFRLGGLTGDTDLSSLRWTVDYLDDFELVTKIFEALYPDKPAFTTADILDLIARDPKLAVLNANHQPGEGWKSSFERDREFLKTQDKL